MSRRALLTAAAASYYLGNEFGDEPVDVPRIEQASFKTEIK
jgi:hypothetical protein